MAPWPRSLVPEGRCLIGQIKASSDCWEQMKENRERDALKPDRMGSLPQPSGDFWMQTLHQTHQDSCPWKTTTARI